MMRPFRVLPVLLVMLLSVPALLSAQSVLVKGSPVRIMINREIKLISGEVQSIKGITNLTIKFDYHSKKVCSFQNDEAYLSHITKSYSKKKAQKFVNEWRMLPRAQLEAKFTEVFNKNAMDIGLFASSDSLQVIPTLVIKVLKEDPHFHNGAEGMPPNVSLECTFFNKEGEFLLRFTLTAFGSREKNLTRRFEECYEIAAKMLARDLTTRMLKYDEQNFKKD